MWVKVCGITDSAIAEQVATLKPDAIGLNFYTKSKRHVSVDVAESIVKSLPSDVTPIGLFVNHSLDEVRATCQHCNISTIQLHGDESPEYVAQLKAFSIIKAFRVDESGLDEVAAYLSELETHSVQLKSCLVDARVSGEYGGTGQRAPWGVLKTQWNHVDWPLLILAGGLDSQNVAEAIAASNAFGVDVASGVEATPGRQDLEKVRQFLHNARQACSAD